MLNSLPPLELDGDKLYPHLPPEERAEAAYNLARYIEIVERIYRRTSKLTKKKPAGNVKVEPHLEISVSPPFEDIHTHN